MAIRRPGHREEIFHYENLCAASSSYSSETLLLHVSWYIRYANYPLRVSPTQMCSNLFWTHSSYSYWRE